jgi:hypothetical protein
MVTKFKCYNSRQLDITLACSSGFSQGVCVVASLLGGRDALSVYDVDLSATFRSVCVELAVQVDIGRIGRNNIFFAGLLENCFILLYSFLGVGVLTSDLLQVDLMGVLWYADLLNSVFVGVTGSAGGLGNTSHDVLLILPRSKCLFTYASSTCKILFSRVKHF